MKRLSLTFLCTGCGIISLESELDTSCLEQRQENLGEGEALAQDWSEVAVGRGFACGRHTDNEQRQESEEQECWGEAPELPQRSLRALSAGTAELCGLQSEGSLWCSGDLGDDLPSSEGWEGVRTGDGFACAWKTGELACWGDPPEGAEALLEAASAPVLAAGEELLCALETRTGTVSCTSGVALPEGVYIQISVDGGAVCGMLSDGLVHCGGTLQERSSEPLLLLAASDTQLCGYLHDEVGVWCEGGTEQVEGLERGHYGQLDLDPEGSGGCARQQDGGLICWGDPALTPPQKLKGSEGDDR